MVWRRTMTLTLGVLIVLTACGSGTDDNSTLEPRLQRMLPADTPTVAVTPLSGQPAETRQARGKFFSMYVPANFQENSDPMDNGERLVRFDAPSSKPAGPVRVAVGPDTKSKAGAIEQSYSLELDKQQAGVKDLTRSPLKWPGAQRAILVQWTETPSGAGATDGPQRYWQLITQINDHLIVSIVAIAPVGEFESAGLAKIVETFRPHAA